MYTKLALFCGLTEGQDFEFKQAGYDKIDIPSPKVWIRDVSFEGCRDECKARPSYTAVNYHTFVFLCELDLEPSPEVVPTTDRDPECKGQFEVCTEIGDYDGCNSTDDQGKCFCKHGVNETDKNKCCIIESDPRKMWTSSRGAARTLTEEKARDPDLSQKAIAKNLHSCMTKPEIETECIGDG
ncbi:hypothetical protein MAR_031593 [Mya arenaria]|uniref:Uncharacterized protein n=1 Tax=Mya arenaria TaxID=6604 RepID=A0ABY7F8A2_MYAAR|nr:hypothetical protein MAR_031593 [Mya arenaria]